MADSLRKALPLLSTSVGRRCSGILSLGGPRRTTNLIWLDYCISGFLRSVERHPRNLTETTLSEIAIMDGSRHLMSHDPRDISREDAQSKSSGKKVSRLRDA